MADNKLLDEIRQDVKQVLTGQAEQGQWIKDHTLKTEEQDKRLDNYSGRIGGLERWKSKWLGITIGVPVFVSAFVGLLYLVIRHYLGTEH